tara:strand:- start:3964 stop:4521 length:558 start_codon:yes stop_codon:yes gene_type:complete
MDKQKECIICGESKKLSAFYKHKGMADGHINKCIICNKKYSKERDKRLRNDPEWVEKEKSRGREKYHRLGCKKPTYEMKKITMERYKEKYPEKIRAKNKTQRIKVKVKGNNLHHWSYNKEHYKDVIELSVKDHNTIHRYIVYDQERMMYRVAIELEGWSVGTLLDTRGSSVNYYDLILMEYPTEY